VDYLPSALSAVWVSVFVGLPVAGLPYLWFSRGLDLAAERRMAERERAAALSC
jgi:hypothetical protein